jgi:hypothetical protein
VQKLYLSETRKKCRCSAGTGRADVIGKTRAGKYYLPARGSIPRRLPRRCATCSFKSGAAADSPCGLRRCCPTDPRGRFQPKTFDDALEIVGAPTVAQDQSDRDGLGVSAFREIAQVLAEEVIDAFVDVQFLDEEFQ